MKDLLSTSAAKLALNTAIIFVAIFLPFWQQANYVPDLRPVTDDFCLLWKTDVLSFNGFNENLFSNSSARFSYLFSLNGIYRIGPESIMIVPLAIWLIFVASLTWLSATFKSNKKKKQSFMDRYKNPFIIAGLISSLTYLITPNQFQNYIWATAVLNYLWGITVLLILAGVVWRKIREKKPTFSIKFFALLAFLSMAASGFNEPQTIFITTSSLLLLATHIKSKWHLNHLLTLSVVFLSSLLSMGIILSSEGAQGRIDSSGGASFEPHIIRGSLEATYEMTINRLGDIHWHYAAFLLILALFFGFAQKLPKKLCDKHAAYVLAGFSFISVGVFAGTIFLNVFVSEANFVPVRSLLLGYFLMAASLILVSVFVGQLLRRLHDKYAKQSREIVLVATVASFVLLSAFAIRAFDNYLEPQKNIAAQIEARGKLYDQRQDYLEANTPESGDIYLTSLGLRGGAPDLRTFRHWINDCFAKYNGLEDVNVKTYSEQKL